MSKCIDSPQPSASFVRHQTLGMEPRTICCGYLHTWAKIRLQIRIFIIYNIIVKRRNAKFYEAVYSLVTYWYAIASFATVHVDITTAGGGTSPQLVAEHHDPLVLGHHDRWWRNITTAGGGTSRTLVAGHHDHWWRYNTTAGGGITSRPLEVDSNKLVQLFYDKFRFFEVMKLSSKINDYIGRGMSTWCLNVDRVK